MRYPWITLHQLFLGINKRYDRSKVKSAVKRSAVLGQHLDSLSGGQTILVPRHTLRNPRSTKEFFLKEVLKQAKCAQKIGPELDCESGLPPPPSPKALLLQLQALTSLACRLGLGFLGRA